MICPGYDSRLPSLTAFLNEAFLGWAQLAHPVGDLFQNKNLDWFPRMRAMSLVCNEGEGEQNEIRILQDKLNSTMKLVSHLTAQLNELKEQVCTQSHPWGPQLQSLTGGGVTAQPATGERGRVLGPSHPFLSFLGLGWKTGFRDTLSPMENQT